MMPSIFRTSPLRITGMFSGIDTESIVRQSLKARQIQMDGRVRARQMLEWRQSSLSEVRADLVNFRRRFLSAATTNSVVSSSAWRNEETAFNAIREMVDEYNTLVGRMESLVRERPQREFQPLTDAERAEMTETQIADWEARAQQGILRNNHHLQSLTTQMRNSLFERIEATGMSVADFGLSTGNFFDGRGGQIVLDEDRLRSALETNFDQVRETFVGENGWAFRLSDITHNFLLDSANNITSLERGIRQQNDQIQRIQDRMAREEERLFQQFAVMEEVMARLEAQGSWLSQIMLQNF